MKVSITTGYFTDIKKMQEFIGDIEIIAQVLKYYKLSIELETSLRIEVKR